MVILGLAVSNANVLGKQLALTQALRAHALFHEGKERGPGIHCLRMCQIFMEFHETVFS